MLRERIRRAVREDPRLVALLVAAAVLLYFGVWRVHPHQMVPDEVGATALPFTLIDGSPGLTVFKKGGNLHIWLLTLAYLPVLAAIGVVWLATGKLDRNLENAQAIAKYEDGKQWDVVNGAVMDAFNALVTAGRVVSATAGLATVLALVLLGRRLYGRPAGYLAGGTLSVTLGFVLVSKYATEDALAACMLAWTLVPLAKHADTGEDRPLLIAAGVAGLAISAKATTGILAIPIAYFALRRYDPADLPTLSAVRELVRYPAAAIGAYVATTPSLLVHPDRYVAELTRYGSVRAGETAFYAHPDPGYVAHTGHLAAVFGVPLFALVVVSFLAVVALTATGRLDPFAWVPLGLAALYLAIISNWGNVQHNRVFVAVPLLALFVGLAAAWASSAERPRLRTVAAPVVALVLVVSLIYTASAVAGWSTSRAEATEWAGDNFDAGANVTTLGQRTYLPELPDGVNVTRIVADPMYNTTTEAERKRVLSRVRCNRPTHLVLTSYHYERYFQDPSFAPEVTALYRSLLDETDYRIVESFGPEEPNLEKDAAGRIERALQLRPPAISTNNPRILFMERTGDPVADCPGLGADAGTTGNGGMAAAGARNGTQTNIAK